MGQETCCQTADRIRQALKLDPVVRGYNLTVSTSPHTVTINGTVRSYFHKQTVQELVSKCMESLVLQRVAVLRNEIVVESN